MSAISRRQGLTLAMSTGLTAAGRGVRAQQSRNVMVGGFDVGPGGGQGNFNPLATGGGFQSFNLYYDTLVAYDVALETISGALAASFSANATATEHRFHLRPGVTWHDGAPFTAADVAFTVDLARDPQSGSVFGSRLSAITNVAMPDPLTAVFTLDKPVAGLPDILTKMMVLPKHALEKFPRDGLDRNPWWSTAPIGTGPFRFVRYETDQFVELKANPAYRNGRPKLEGIINRYFRNTAGAVAALRSGEIQFSYVESDEAQGFAGNPDFRTIEGDSWVLNYIGINHAAGIWGDVRVRRALMHALNRDGIVKSILKGAAEVANAPYVVRSVTPRDLDPYPYDPAKARALLADAGWERINDSKPLPLLTYYNTPQASNILAAMQAMLAQVGVNVVPRAVDVATYNGIVRAPQPDHGQFPLTYAGAQIGPEAGIADINLNEKQIPPAGYNLMRIRMPELNAALNAGVAEADLSRRPARFQEVARVFNRELPWAPMWVAKRYGIVSSKITGFVWTPAPGGGGYEQHAERWAFS